MDIFCCKYMCSIIITVWRNKSACESTQGEQLLPILIFLIKLPFFIVYVLKYPFLQRSCFNTFCIFKVKIHCNSILGKEILIFMEEK